MLRPRCLWARQQFLSITSSIISWTSSQSCITLYFATNVHECRHACSLTALTGSLSILAAPLQVDCVDSVAPQQTLTHRLGHSQQGSELLAAPLHQVDCIDSVAPKKMLIAAACGAGLRVVSSMGAGGRVDPSRVKVVDLSKTFNDPFAALLRKVREGTACSRQNGHWERGEVGGSAGDIEGQGLLLFLLCCSSILLLLLLLFLLCLL